jgi:hypothetical protein
MMPLMGLLLIVPLKWSQFLALFGLGDEPAHFDLARKVQPLPLAYIITILTVIVLFESLPYMEELGRGLIANGGRLVPFAARRENQ